MRAGNRPRKVPRKDGLGSGEPGRRGRSVRLAQANGDGGRGRPCRDAAGICLRRRKGAFNLGLRGPALSESRIQHRFHAGQRRQALRAARSGGARLHGGELLHAGHHRLGRLGRQPTARGRQTPPSHGGLQAVGSAGAAGAGGAALRDRTSLAAGSGRGKAPTTRPGWRRGFNLWRGGRPQRGVQVQLGSRQRTGRPSGPPGPTAAPRPAGAGHPERRRWEPRRGARRALGTEHDGKCPTGGCPAVRHGVPHRAWKRKTQRGWGCRICSAISAINPAVALAAGSGSKARARPLASRWL